MLARLSHIAMVFSAVMAFLPFERPIKQRSKKSASPEVFVDTPQSEWAEGQVGHGGMSVSGLNYSEKHDFSSPSR